MVSKRVLTFILICLFATGCASRPERRTSYPVTPPRVAQPARPVPAPAPSLPQPRTPSLVLVADDQLPTFSDDMDLASLEKAMEKSQQYFNRAAVNAPRPANEAWGSVPEQKETLAALWGILRSGKPEEIIQQEIRESFDIYQSTGQDGKNNVLFTGYFEPIMNGSLERTERYRFPIYGPPGDAINVNLGRFGDKYKNDQLVGRLSKGELLPYYNRREIEDLGSLEGRNLELAWVDDRINLFFLHIQGSGKIRLPDGSLLQIGYRSQNGRPYRSLARFLVDTGRISPKEISYQAIKRFLREHPEDLSEVLAHNESFIFFREVKEGPVGSLGQILTAGRSIATDPAVFPKGALAFMRLRKPILDEEGNVVSWVPFSRFVLNQDTGGAIKGAGRVDIFCGTGDDAEWLAGSFKERGELYFLVKKRPNGP